MFWPWSYLLSLWPVVSGRKWGNVRLFYGRTSLPNMERTRVAYVRIWNASQQSVVCENAAVADTARTRLFGLLGKRSLAEDTGLWIKPSSGVHTWAMSMPIDIVALDRNNMVIGAYENVGPWKVRGLSLRTKSVLELPSGRISRTQLHVGDQLQFKQ